MTTTTGLTVANEIKRQIGGRALFMIWAWNLCGDSSSLSFRIRGSKLVNYIKIVLCSDDTYRLEFWKIHGMKFMLRSREDGVYCDMLHKMIEKNTGLYTSL